MLYREYKISECQHIVICSDNELLVASLHSMLVSLPRDILNLIRNSEEWELILHNPFNAICKHYGEIGHLIIDSHYEDKIEYLVFDNLKNKLLQ
jgi:hypothetical protein